MDRNRFNAQVRPYVSEVRIGSQGIAFDRLELDAWWEHCKSRNERRPKAFVLEDDICQKPTECQGSAVKVASGTSKNAAKKRLADGSEKARAHLRDVRQKKR